MIGVCDICGQGVPLGASFVDIGPTDWNEPTKPRSQRFVPIDEDIHGGTPFVIEHPACFAREHGIEALVRLVDESHRSLRRRLNHEASGCGN